MSENKEKNDDIIEYGLSLIHIFVQSQLNCMGYMKGV